MARKAQSPELADLDSLCKRIEKAYGEGTVKRASESHDWLHIPTGIFQLDMALHGGIPRSQMTLCYGYASSGKTTLSLRLLANAQKLLPDYGNVFIDVEGTLDKNWAARQGVNCDELIHVEPSTGEAALDIAYECIMTPNVGLIVVDSLASLLPYKESEISTEDDLPGLQARLIGKFVRKNISGIVEMRKRGHYPALLLLNQWRSKIGVLYGDPRTLPGGIAQHNNAFVKIEISNKEIEGKDDKDINTVDYNEHQFKIAKHKEGVGIRHGEFRMIRNPNNLLGQGFIDDGRTVATYARKFGLITGGGAGGFKIAGVEDSFRVLDDIVEYFYKNREFYDSFKNKLISMYRESNGLNPEGWL